MQFHCGWSISGSTPTKPYSGHWKSTYAYIILAPIAHDLTLFGAYIFRLPAVQYIYDTIFWYYIYIMSMGR